MPEPHRGVYLLLGPEEGQKTDAISALVAGLAARVGEQPEIHRFYAFESPVPAVISTLRNMSLFARHRVAILSSAEEIRKKEDVEACLDYISSPSPDATLILVSSELARGVDRKIVAAVPKEAQRVFWEMYESQKSGWIINFFKQREITVERSAVEYLLEVVENNTRDLRTECEKLALFFGKGSTVTLESVEQYIYHSKEENVFTLFDQVSSRNLLSAEEVLEKLLLSKEAEGTQITSGLLWQFRKLSGLKRLLDDNYDAAEALTRSGVTSKKGQRTYGEANKNYSREELESISLLLTEFDSRFRSLKTDLHALLLHLMLYYIVVRGGGGAWRLGL